MVASTGPLEYPKAIGESMARSERRKFTDARWLEANRERKKAQQDAWRAANKEHIRKRNAAYRAANKERKAAYLREWQKANPEKVREAALRRIARKKEARTYVITDKDLRRITSAPCAFPGCTGTDIELDHVIPLSRGGSHGIGNLQPLCRHHNRTKHNKTWIEYRAYLALQAAA